MKIFGKRKSSSGAAPGTTATADADATSLSPAGARGETSTSALSTKAENEDVPSYFAQASTISGSSSSKKKKQRHDDSTSSQQPNGDDIQTLLAMDPSTLNSKQRRLVRRHQEREGIEDTNAVESAETVAASASTPQVQIATQGTRDNQSVNSLANGDESSKITNCNQQEVSSAATTSTAAAAATTTDMLAKLEGLNSKDRRKFLRQLRSSIGGNIDESVIAAAEEQARKVAERNEQEAVHTNAISSKASKASTAKNTVDQSIPKPKRRKKNPINLDDLDPEERKRREAQRMMQKEAADRRASGLVDPSRHPLNSERRRANRRKPGKAAKIVQAKKEQLAERGKFNAVGYQMRKKGGQEK